jgi:hypothetical protein
LNRAGADGAPPEKVAETIWRAATDGTTKLRYPVHDLGLLTLRRLIPESWFRAAVRRKLLKGL